MTNIETILSLLNKELQQLVASYQQQIDELYRKNRRLDAEIDELSEMRSMLKSEIDSLLSENLHLKEQISHLGRGPMNSEREEMLIQLLMQLSSAITYEMIDDLFFENAYLLLMICTYCIEEGEMEKVQYIIDLFHHNPTRLLEDSKMIHMLDGILNKLISTGNQELNDSTEKAIESCMELISVLHDTYLKGHLKNYLHNHYSGLLDILLYSNEPKYIIRLLNLLLVYELGIELKEVIAHIIKKEWEFLDYNVTKNEFCFFLWYAFLFDLDQLLLEKTEEGLKWLRVEQSELQLYTFMYDSLNEQKIIDKPKLKVLMNRFRLSHIFTEQESNQIIEKVENTLKPLMKEAPLMPAFLGKLTMVNQDDLQHVINDYKLELQEMRLPLFKNIRINLPSRFVNQRVYLSNNTQRAFISSEQVDEVHNRYYPEVLNVVKMGEGNVQTKTKPSEKATKPKNSKTSVTFQWPSTEVQENKQVDSHEQPTLNENSELKRLGYQITGLTRAKRWAILEKAVPALGLRRVAYIIAHNVRMRKGQKNGLIKFKYAIGEWEYDLDKLKKTYYKKEFTWPSY